MSNIVKVNTEIDKDLLQTIIDTIYPGCSRDSALMVMGYCKAAGLDPIQKLVHLVPMNVKVGRDYEWRDVVMPGIGLYRIQASRTGVYAGITEPEFGPVINTVLGEVKVSYPEWCKTTVKKVVHGILAEFTAMEYWIENYATAKKDTDAPNAMWKKRSYGQLAKCSEAQALRKAFPESVSHQPTAEEMEGKTFSEQKFTSAKNITPSKPKDTPVTPEIDIERIEDVAEESQEQLTYRLERFTYLEELLKKYEVPQEKIDILLNWGKVSEFNAMDIQNLEKVIAKVEASYT